MIHLVKSVRQALNSARDRLESTLQSLKTVKSDDTVEAQANTFRIWMWTSAAGLALIVVASAVSRHSKENSTVSPKIPPSSQEAVLDSLPDGYVIAPIEPLNGDSLDSIFGEHGYADIYRPTGNGEKGKRIARSLALVRAPKNPRRFAVLVPDSQSEILSQLSEPVLVILRKGPLPDKRDADIRSDSKPHRARRRPENRIELIQEDIPEMAPDSGVKS